MTKPPETEAPMVEAPPEAPISDEDAIAPGRAEAEETNGESTAEAEPADTLIVAPDEQTAEDAAVLDAARLAAEAAELAAEAPVDPVEEAEAEIAAAETEAAEARQSLAPPARGRACRRRHRGRSFTEETARQPDEDFDRLDDDHDRDRDRAGSHRTDRRAGPASRGDRGACHRLDHRGQPAGGEPCR